MKHHAQHTEETSSKPRRIVIFRELIETALDPELDSVVLFGMAEYLEDPQHLYDVVYHVKADVADPFCTVNPRRLITPVIRGSQDEVVRTIHSLHEKHPAFTRYAAVDNSLTFWDVEQHPLGVEVRQRRYCTVGEQQLWDYAELPGKEEKVKFFRRAIDRRFRPGRKGFRFAPASATTGEPQQVNAD